jgi:hypothetical protein
LPRWFVDQVVTAAIEIDGLLGAPATELEARVTVVRSETLLQLVHQWVQTLP